MSCSKTEAPEVPYAACPRFLPVNEIYCEAMPRAHFEIVLGMVGHTASSALFTGPTEAPGSNRQTILEQSAMRCVEMPDSSWMSKSAVEIDQRCKRKTYKYGIVNDPELI